jgi:ABC-2 type transport system permease protein
MFPLTNLPKWLRLVARGNPLTYGVDGLRAALLGRSELPLLLDMGVLSSFALLSIVIGAWLFKKSEYV